MTQVSNNAVIPEVESAVDEWLSTSYPNLRETHFGSEEESEEEEDYDEDYDEDYEPEQGDSD